MAHPSRSPLVRLAFAGAALGALVSFQATAALPLDLGVYRAKLGVVFLDFNRDPIPDRRLRLSPAPEYVLAADMDGDGIADIVTYSAGVWTVDFNEDGVPDATYFFGGAPGDTPLLGDVDGDGKVDLVIYRDGAWYASTHRNGIADRATLLGGAPGDIPVLGDLNCDGIADPIIYRSGVWFADLDGDGNADVVLGFGGDGRDRPFIADWDGDCNGDLGVYRDGDWYVMSNPLSQPVVRTTSFGAAGDTPIAARLDRGLTAPKYRRLSTRAGIYRPADRTFIFQMTPGNAPDLILNPGVAGTALAADLDGNGKSSLIVYAGGIWLVDHGMDGTADEMFAFGGAPQDVPLAGDVDGDGHADLVIYRAGAWFVSTTRDGNVAIMNYFGGVPGDIPVLGDVDGDGKADFGIYRDGIWYFDTNRDGVPDVAYGFGGASGDVPLLADWNGDGKPDLIIYRAGRWFVSTLSAPGVPYAQFTLGAASDIPVAGNFVVETTAAPVLFAMQARPIKPRGEGLLPPAVADYDGDGRFEPLGGRNNGAGAITSIDLAASGLASIYSPGRVNRDCRAADFNGDGKIDLVCNTYSTVANAASFARLFIGAGGGYFVEHPAFAAQGIRGFGETIVAADFNNDGAVDLFIPFYSHNDPAEHSWLLVNDGTGHFTDVADAAGVALRGMPAGHRVEGAQAVDFDGDGWIDFYVAGRLFRNNGNLTFTDITNAVGLPGDFDEGIKFLDWNNDGWLDLVINHPTYGPALWEFDGARFTRRDVMPDYLTYDIFGVNVADLNGDGREDIVIAGGAVGTSYVLLNTGARYERNPLTLFDALSFGPVSAYDYDGDGAIDLVMTRGIRNDVVARNISPGINRQTLTIDVVDAAGRRNQFGRVARIRPDVAPGVTMTRIVDGGSGMLAQTPYPLTVPTPYTGTHRVDVRFATGTVSFTMQPGARVRVYADGRTESF